MVVEAQRGLGSLVLVLIRELLVSSPYHSDHAETLVCWTLLVCHKDVGFCSMLAMT